MTRRKDISNELQEIGPNLARIAVTNPYRVPAHYFENLADLILIRIRTESAVTVEEELEMISPLLGGLKKSTPFSVPEGYFENLTARVTEKEEGARVISIPSRKFLKYAAAAITIGLITVLAWFFIKSPMPAKNQYAVKKDSAAEKQIQKKISEISDNEIASYVENSTMNDEVYSASDLKDEGMQAMLADISDHDLEKYLEQNVSLKEKLN